MGVSLQITAVLDLAEHPLDSQCVRLYCSVSIHRGGGGGSSSWVKRQIMEWVLLVIQQGLFINSWVQIRSIDLCPMSSSSSFSPLPFSLPANQKSQAFSFIYLWRLLFFLTTAVNPDCFQFAWEMSCQKKISFPDRLFE